MRYATSWPGRKPTHSLKPSSDGKYSVTQLFQHRAAFSCIRRPVEDDWRLGYDRPGRHAPAAERGQYVIGNVLRFVNEISAISTVLF